MVDRLYSLFLNSKIKHNFTDVRKKDTNSRNTTLIQKFWSKWNIFSQWFPKCFYLASQCCFLLVCISFLDSPYESMIGFNFERGETFERFLYFLKKYGREENLNWCISFRIYRLWHHLIFWHIKVHKHAGTCQNAYILKKNNYIKLETR